ncbi:MAG TPA: EAL domain-containing protein [Anaeromyxobacteraceae bacterium]|nr:EAL domain-containing protein [Anaeromyxobacteraceae bacterium]
MPKTWILAAVALAGAAALAARPILASARWSVELGRARDAAELSHRLRALLAALPQPPPHCAAACLTSDDAASADAVEEMGRLASALAALPGEPDWRSGTGRLRDLAGSAGRDPSPRDAGAEDRRREAEALAAGVEAAAQVRLVRAGEALRSSLPMALGAGGAGLVLGLFSILAVVRRSSLRRRQEQGRDGLLRAVEQVRDLVTIADGRGRIQYVNKAVEDVTGYSRDELVGTRSRAWLPWYQGVPFLEEMQRTVLAGRPYRGGVLGRRKTGEAFLAEETVTPLSDPTGTLQGILSTARDVTEQRLLECTLDHRAKHDALTGLPNRRHFLHLLDHALHAAGGERSAVVLVVDLDRFSQLNDLMGSAAGDQLLAQVSQRLRALAGEDLVGRLGGDEFALARIADRSLDVAAVVEEVRRAVSMARAGPDDLAVTAAVGIAVAPDHGRDARTLVEDAYLALGQAKTRGRGAVVHFDLGLARGTADALLLEQRLAGAFRNGEYLIRYQPYYELASRRLAGAEALMQWKSADLGAIPAARFVPLLEENGMIVEVGMWVLETACRQAREWQARRLALPVSVNLSGAQFRDRGMVQAVAEAIDRHRLDPARLALEVTESVCLDDLDFAVGTLKRLKGLGVSISVDDFGTGYSSLSYLKRLPVDTLKIDMSFVRDVTRDQDAASIVSAITTLARSMQLRTIAEGVETEEQRNVLHLLRCDMGQGYYFSPAVTPAEMPTLAGGAAAVRA